MSRYLTMPTPPLPAGAPRRARGVAISGALGLLLLATPSTAQQTVLRGFADVTARTSSLDGEHPQFAIGQFDLFLTSRLGDDVSFLGETVFEFDEDAGSFIVDVERVLLTYAPEPYFRIVAGKHHTPIGYWNTAYHHGALLQPTIERPMPLLFEDEGGVLPIHTTGVLVAGREISPLHLSYDVMIGNGVGATPIGDNNLAKSFTASVHANVTDALSIGASAYTDQITLGTPNLAGVPVTADVRQWIVSGFVAWFGPRAELLSEYLRISHRQSGVTAANTDAWYAYAGVRFGKVVPYVRYDLLNYPAADPYFVTDSAEMGLAGLRFEWRSTAAIKLELRRRDTDAAGARTESAVQFAITF